jgi:hypothetical protein
MRGRKLKGVEDGPGEGAGKVGGAKGKGVGQAATAGMVGLREGEMKVVGLSFLPCLGLVMFRSILSEDMELL